MDLKNIDIKNLSAKDIKYLFRAKSALISLVILTLLIIIQNRHNLLNALLHIIFLAPPLVYVFNHYVFCKKGEHCDYENNDEDTEKEHSGKK